jgi:hypothetical protein
VQRRRHYERDRLGHLDAKLLEGAYFLRVVGEEADPIDTEIGQDSGRLVVPARVDREAEIQIGVDRVASCNA